MVDVGCIRLNRVGSREGPTTPGSICEHHPLILRKFSSPKSGVCSHSSLGVLECHKCLLFV
ncbi:hypothetical protein HanIR_Chr16g0814811 [Helianthus annuus]|nr:hypothetical protein HanIR_Chr16g0814811 [Helianthus annuus]